MSTTMTPTPVRVTRGPGLHGPVAVLLAGGLALLGGLLDAATGTGLRWMFGLGFVGGCLAAAALVRASGLRTVAVAPPLLYAGLALLFAVARGSGTERGLTTHVMSLFTELVFGAPVLIAGTLGALAVVLLRVFARR